MQTASRVLKTVAQNAIDVTRMQELSLHWFAPSLEHPLPADDAENMTFDIYRVK